MCAAPIPAVSADFSKDVLALHDAGFEQISVEPVVLTPDSPYALRPDQLPGLLDEYEEAGPRIPQAPR